MRNRIRLKEYVERMQNAVKLETEVVEWIEEDIDGKIGLYNYCDSVQELVDFFNMPYPNSQFFRCSLPESYIGVSYYKSER